MTEEFFPVTETVVFIRILQYGEGKRGKFAVALVKHEENQFTLLLAEEEFPAAKAKLIKEGQILRVKPSQRGLRARIKDQDFKLFAENQERIAIEVSRFNDKLDAVENRQIERLDQFERIIQDLKRVIICWDDIHDD